VNFLYQHTTSHGNLETCFTGGQVGVRKLRPTIGLTIFCSQSIVRGIESGVAGAAEPGL
jgi:hypothetical protein